MKALIVDPMDRVANMDRSGRRVESEIGKVNVDSGQERAIFKAVKPE
jgi:hypothetical protein